MRDLKGVKNGSVVFILPQLHTYSLYGTKGSTNVQYGDFYVYDPDKLECVIADVQTLPGQEWDGKLIWFDL